MTPDLRELASKLTIKERTLAELMAEDPTRVQWKAAREAGYAGGEKALGVQATRTLSKTSVQAYITSIGSKAMDRIEKRTDRRIANLADTLAGATAILEVDATSILDDQGEVSIAKLRELPIEQRRALAIEISSTTDEDGQVFARHKVKRDPVALGAAKLLVDHYNGVGQAPSGTTIINVIRGLPETAQKALACALLSQVVDVEAKEVK